MRFLQTEWHRHERDRNAWEIERQEMKGRIAKLEGSGRRGEARYTSLEKYVNMLEKAVRDRDGKIKKLKLGNTEVVETAEEKNVESLAVKGSARREFPHVEYCTPRLIYVATLGAPRNSFLDTEDLEGRDSQAYDDTDRSGLRGFMEKSHGELAYLLVAPSNPLPPREGSQEEYLHFAHSQNQSTHESYDAQNRQRDVRATHMVRSSPVPNHQPPSIPLITSLPVRNTDNTSQNTLEQRNQSSTVAGDWTSADSRDKSPEEPVTKINHSFDAYGRQTGSEEFSDAAPLAEVDGWDFNETGAFPDAAMRPTTQRPDTDMFPITQDIPKSPGRGPMSHRRKGSTSRRKSAEHDLTLHATQKPDNTNFKVRFGLRGHLDAVRSVIFTGGGSPSEPELCTAGDDGVVKRWIVPSRYDSQGSGHNAASDLDVQSYFTHRGHAGSVLCLTSWSPSVNFSSGGRAQGDGWIFSGGQDATIRVWERGRIDPKATLEGHTDAIWAICVLPGTTGTIFGPHNSFGGPDRILLASGAADGVVKVWSVTTPPSLVSPSGGSIRRGGRVRGNSMSSGSAFPSSPQPSMASNSPCHYTLIHSISREGSTASPTSITPLSASGEAFVVAYADAACLVYDTRSGDQVASMASLETYDGTINTAINAAVATTVGLDRSPGFGPQRSSHDEDGMVSGATGRQGGVEGVVITGHEDRFIRFYDANSGKWFHQHAYLPFSNWLYRAMYL